MIDRNSYGTLAWVLLFGIALGYVMLRFVHTPWIVWPVLAMIAWFYVWQLFFFNVPKRKRTGSDKKISSVADGRVVILEKVYEPEFLKCECIQISVYMNFFDVHANFWPMDGVVVYAKHYPGLHALAFKPKSSEENEHTCIGIANKAGQKIFYKQIAGGFARRIVSYAHEGVDTRAGSQCGIIKFGSRIDLFLPLDAKIKVALGDLVRASETILAEL